MSFLWILFDIILAAVALIIILKWNHKRHIYNVKTGETIFEVPFWDIPAYFLSNTKGGYDRHWLYPQIQGKDVYMSWLGPLSYVTICDGKLIQEILSDNEKWPKEPSALTKTVARFVGSHSVTRVNGDAWKRQRRSMNPAFQDLDLYQEIFAEKATAIIKSMELTENGVVPNINKFMQKLTLDVLGKAIFGHEFHSIEGSTASDLKSYNHIMEAMFSVKYLIFGRIYERFPNSPFMKNMNDSVDNIHQLFRALIKDAKAKLDLKNEKKRSMLEYLVQANMSNDEEEHLDDDELITNIGVFFLAGHETTSTALSYEITLLAKNPEIQEKLRKEINVSIPGEMNKENLAKCEFLNAFIKESMRCYPPVAVVPSRKAAKDSVLGDWNIPAGTRIALNFLAVHMSKESYGDPENFRPERWLSEEQAKKKIPNNAWIPFSTGSRVCIGNNFSLYEQRVFLVELLKNYKISTNETGPVISQRGMIITPPEACVMKFTRI